MTQDKLQESVLDKLMYESGLTADGSFGDMDQYDQEAIMRFAELIVHECSAVCDRIYFDRYPEAEDYERSEEGEAILERFGIDS
jgi:hypothetical protein